MVNEPENTTPIQNVYARRFLEDLAANRKKQDDITSQIACLQERMERLQQEEAWLAQAQGTLSPSPALREAEDGEPPAEAEKALPVAETDRIGPEREAPAHAATPTEGTSAVPQPRQGKRAKAAHPQPAAKAKPSATKAAPKRAKAQKTTEPPLHKLVQDILLKTPGEPRVAREVHDELVRDHPERVTSVQVVRNNLELLVKKNTAEKTNQQGSAMYTAYATEAAPADTADVTGGEGEQVGETAPADV